MYPNQYIWSAQESWAREDRLESLTVDASADEVVCDEDVFVDEIAVEVF
jgi:hypothetical protein